MVHVLFGGHAGSRICMTGRGYVLDHQDLNCMQGSGYTVIDATMLFLGIVWTCGAARPTKNKQTQRNTAGTQGARFKANVRDKFLASALVALIGL